MHRGLNVIRKILICKSENVSRSLQPDSRDETRAQVLAANIQISIFLFASTVCCNLFLIDSNKSLFCHVCILSSSHPDAVCIFFMPRRQFRWRPDENDGREVCASNKIFI